MDDTIHTTTGQVEHEMAVQATHASVPFVGRWNRLVSTTNWEKGRIIFEWREALRSDGASARDFADEAWSRLVGCVTAQHVGRLRRVFERFGHSYQQFEGLCWSHFQAALDWDDAEMYLEGAVQNRWSVSQMRRTRWEAMGRLEADRPDAEDVVVAELDEDFEPADKATPVSGTISSSYDRIDGLPTPTDAPSLGEDAQCPAAPGDDPDAPLGGEASAGEQVQAVRPFEQLGELPGDVAEAFEAFKLAILRHKADRWQQIALDELLASLDALKELALA